MAIAGEFSWLSLPFSLSFSLPSCRYCLLVLIACFLFNYAFCSRRLPGGFVKARRHMYPGTVTGIVRNPYRSQVCHPISFNQPKLNTSWWQVIQMQGLCLCLGHSPDTQDLVQYCWIPPTETHYHLCMACGWAIRWDILVWTSLTISMPGSDLHLNVSLFICHFSVTYNHCTF